MRLKSFVSNVSVYSLSEDGTKIEYSLDGEEWKELFPLSLITPNISFEEPVGLEPGATPTVENVGDGFNVNLQFGLPKAPEVNVSSTTTIGEGNQAKVTNSGTPYAPVLNFQIPKGDTGRGITIKGFYPDLSTLQEKITSPAIGDVYCVGTAEPYTGYVWTNVYSSESQTATPAWQSIGSINKDTTILVNDLGDREDVGMTQKGVTSEMSYRTILNALIFNGTNGESSDFDKAILPVPISQRFPGQIIVNQDRLNRWIFRYNVATRTPINDETWNASTTWEEIYTCENLPEIPNLASSSQSYFRQGLENINQRFRRAGLRVDVTLNRDDENVGTYHLKYVGSDVEEDMLNDDYWGNLQNWKFIQTSDELPDQQSVLLSETLIKDKFVICDNVGGYNNGDLSDEEGAFSTEFIYCKNLNVVYYTGFAHNYSGVAFYNTNREYIGCDYRLRNSYSQGEWLTNFPVKIPKEAYWLRASSRNIIEGASISKSNTVEIRGEISFDAINNTILQDLIDTSGVYLNGETSVVTFNDDVVLKEDGDSLEFESFVYSREEQPAINDDDNQTHNVFYCLFGTKTLVPNTSNSYNNIIGFPNIGGQVMVRANDGTWIFNNPTSVSTDVWNSFRMHYNNGRIDLYVNGELVASNPAQYEFRMKYIGQGYRNYYLHAKVRNVKINGVDIDFKDKTNISFGSSSYISKYDGKQSSVDLTTIPEQYYIKTSDELTVYYRRYSNSYIAYHLYKRYKAWDADIASAGTAPNYYDNWGIEMCTEEEFDGSTFTKVRDLYRTGETELAIRVNGDAYVGGATHGYENIRNSNQTRLFNIFIDGRMIGEESESEGEFTNISVNMSSYLAHMQTQNNFLQADKEWVFADKRLKLTTKIKFLEAATVNDCMTAMLLCLRNQVTTSSIKSTDIYKVYDISMDSWVDNPENSSLKTRDANAKWIRNWSSKYSFQLTSLEDNRTTGGGMFVTTNDSSYNKIYLELAKEYSAKENEELYSVTEFENL